MHFLSDVRGVSEVLGAILVFALVLAVLVIIQVAGVPAANQQIEFEHNTRVQADFQEFDQSVDQASISGASESIAVETGVRYPPRLFLINPGPAAGTLSTTTATDVAIGNVTSANDETADFIDGSLDYNGATRSLVFEPSYNEYGTAPSTVYEHGVLYNTDEKGNAVFDPGNLVSGNRISLTVLDGSVSESSTKSVSVTARPISAPAQTVSVSPSGGPLTLKVYTSLSEDTWEDVILADEYDPNGNIDGRYVSDIRCTDASVASNEPCNGLLVIEFEQGTTYDLRLSKVGVGSGATEESAAYLTKVGDVNPVVDISGSQLSVQARDRFNNPVSGVEVTFTSDDGTSGDAGDFVDSNGNTQDTMTVTTDESGTATVTFVPQSDQKEVTITATGAFAGSNAVREVTYENLPIETNSNEDDLLENDLNPTRDGFVVLTNAEVLQGTGGDPDYVNVTFENRNASDWDLVEARINFYFIGSSSGNNKAPDTADLIDPSDGSVAQTLVVFGDFEEFTPITFAGNSETTLKLTDWKKADGSDFDPTDQEFFVMTLLFDTDGDGEEDERGTYLVGPRSG